MHYPTQLLCKSAFQRCLLLRRALQLLEHANDNRFVKLKEAAVEKAAGGSEGDLRRLKRHFGSLKNTFILSDVRQSFIEGEILSTYLGIQLRGSSRLHIPYGSLGSRDRSKLSGRLRGRHDCRSPERI